MTHNRAKLLGAIALLLVALAVVPIALRDSPYLVHVLINAAVLSDHRLRRMGDVRDRAHQHQSGCLRNDRRLRDRDPLDALRGVLLDLLAAFRIDCGTGRDCRGLADSAVARRVLFHDQLKPHRSGAPRFLEWREFTRGASGIINVPRPGALSLFGFTLVPAFDRSSPLPYYYLAVALLILTLLALWRIVTVAG